MKATIFYFDGCPPAFVNPSEHFKTSGFTTGIVLMEKNGKFDGNFIVSQERPIVLSDYSIYFDESHLDD